MNAKQLAKDAIQIAELKRDLSATVQEAIAKAHVATWLYQQDGSTSSAALRETFNIAMDAIVFHYGTSV